MKTLIIEPHYLGNLEYFALLTQYDHVCLEINDPFQKKNFRNRCYILGANKIQSLIVPLRYSSGMQVKDVTIDYSQRWVKDHWGALYSAYGKAPYFDYFAEIFLEIWDKKPTHLVDLSIAFLELILKLLQLDIKLICTKNYSNFYENDFRNFILPNKPVADRKIYNPVVYTQLFGDTFVPNLSIMDLIMCEGTRAVQILMASFLRN